MIDVVDSVRRVSGALPVRICSLNSLICFSYWNTAWMQSMSCHQQDVVDEDLFVAQLEPVQLPPDSQEVLLLHDKCERMEHSEQRYSRLLRRAVVQLQEMLELGLTCQTLSIDTPKHAHIDSLAESICFCWSMALRLSISSLLFCRCDN